MKLIVGALMCAAAGGVVFSVSSSRPAVPPTMSALELCLSGGVELIDERCNTAGCAKESVRLAWNHGDGVLFEGDSSGEKELKRLHGAELDGLVADLSALERRDTDGDQLCSQGWWVARDCMAVEQVLTVTTSCGDSASTFTFMRAKPAWERVRAGCEGAWSPERAQCLARSSWQAAFATHLAVRFGTVFHHLRDAGRGG